MITYALSYNYENKNLFINPLVPGVHSKVTHT